MKETKFNTVWLQPQAPENFNDPNHDLKYKQETQNLPSIKTQINQSCKVAWNSICIDHHERVFTCKCDGHVPFPVGHVTDFNNIEEIFNSKQAKLTQESIIKKEYEYCATQFCGVASTNQDCYPGNIYISINFDISCNLTCPSCRERMIFINDKNIIQEKINLSKKIFSWIQQTDKNVIVEFAGGEPMASLIYIRIIELFSTIDRVKFVIRTNGILLKKQLPKFDSSILNKIITLSISIDAACCETYEKIRRGSKWSLMIENLEYVKSLKLLYNEGNFIIQSGNLDDVIPFIKLCSKYNLTPVFSVVQDWGTWHDYESHCVHLPSSVDYNKFREIICNPVFKEYNIDVSDLLLW